MDAISKEMTMKTGTTAMCTIPCGRVVHAKEIGSTLHDLHPIKDEKPKPEHAPRPKQGGADARA
jgi:hypothetical protein